MQPNTHATKRTRLAAAFTSAAQAIASRHDIVTTEDDHYDAYKVFMNWKHVRQKRAATIIQRFYRRKKFREDYMLVSVSRRALTGKLTLVYDDRY